jgi:hypothetical protein
VRQDWEEPSTEYVRIIQPVRNLFEDINIGSVGVVETGCIDKTNIGVKYFWDRKSDDRYVVCAGLQAMSDYSFDASSDFDELLHLVNFKF